MRAITSGRLALVLSLLALVVATSGVGYAAGKIKGNQIATNAITSPKVKNNSLTGQDVRESTLGRVPSASTASSANSAGTAGFAANAGTVNGVVASRVFYKSQSDGPNTPVFSGSGLTLSAGCSGLNEVTLTARTTVDEASIYVVAASDASPTDPAEADQEGGGFGPGTTFDMLAGGNGDVELLSFEYDTPTGGVVTGQLAVDENASSWDCAVTGMAFSQ